MGEQLTASGEALRLFFTEDIYLVAGEELAPAATAAEVKTKAAVVEIPVTETAPMMVSEPVVKPELTTASKAEDRPAPSFKFLGKNQKNILIIVNDDLHEVSTEQGRELLRKLVKAIDLTANDFALLNYSAYKGTDFNTFNSYFSSKLVLLFGVNPVDLGLKEQPQHQIVMHEAIQLVYTSNLDVLAEDQQGKKILWGSLQKLK